MFNSHYLAADWQRSAGNVAERAAEEKLTRNIVYPDDAIGHTAAIFPSKVCKVAAFLLQYLLSEKTVLTRYVTKNSTRDFIFKQLSGRAKGHRGDLCGTRLIFTTSAWYLVHT